MLPLFKTIVESSTHYLYLKDTAGKWIACSKPLKKFFAISIPESVDGKTDDDLVWKKLPINTQDEHSNESVIQLDLDETTEEMYQSPRGEICHFLTEKFPLKNQDGSVVAIFYYSVDIGILQRELRKEKEQREMLEKIITIMPGHVYWKDRDCVLQGCNYNQAVDAGLTSPKDIVGKTAYDLLWQDQPEELKREQAGITDKIDHEIMQSGRKKTVEEFVITPRGSKIIYLSEKVPIKNDLGDVAGLVGISIDITEKKILEEELKEAKRESEKNEELANYYLNNILAGMPGHVYWMDKNGVYLGCNDQQAKSCGLSSPNDIVGKINKDLPLNVAPGLCADELDKVNQQVMGAGIECTIEEPALTKEGKVEFFLSKKTPLRDKTGNVVGLVGISINITDKKKLETDLRTAKTTAEEKEKLLQHILTAMPGNVYWKDRDGIYLGCNETMAKMAGLNSANDVIGKTDFDLCWKNDAKIFRENDLKVMASGQMLITEEPVTASDGTQKFFWVTKIPLRDDNDNIVGILGNSLDITDRKKVEEAKFDSMRLIAGSIAHELRTPLSSIQGNATSLKEKFNELIDGYEIAADHHLFNSTILPMQIDLLRRMPDNLYLESRSALTIIDLLLTNIQNQQMVLMTKAQFSVKTCVDTALERYPFKPEQLELVSWEGGADFNLLGSHELMMYVLFNLLRNSLYFLAKASKAQPVYIRIKLGEDVQSHFLSFEDEGTGIEPNDLPHIFDRFYTKNSHHGSGIGLSFCKMVTEAHGGKITCESKLGEYTRFTLRFPKSG